MTARDESEGWPSPPGSPPDRGAGVALGEWRLVSAEEMRALDAATIEGRGVPGEVLMENAGRALVVPAVGLRARSERPAGPVLVLAGAGNNGGDGFVVARHLFGEGIPVEVVLIGDPEKLPPDAAANWRRLAPFDVPARAVAPEDAVDVVSPRLARASVVIDALFGTGLQRDLTGGFAAVVEATNAARASGVRVLAVDSPSGIDSRTGAVLGAAILADETVTIALPKLGLVLEPGGRHARRIRVARIGIADPDPDAPDRVELWNARAASSRFPDRVAAGHKGTFGHVLVIAGSTGKCGAGALSSRAAARGGAGLVTFAYPAGLEAELAALPVEVMSAPVASTEEGGFALAGEKAALELASSRDVVVLGPGLGRHPETDALVRKLLIEVDRPVVLDADGLNALEGAPEQLRDRRAATVITPHPGEAARLLGTTTVEINADRLGAVRRLSERSGAIAVLKGARTLVANPAGRTVVTPTGGPALATGGTGDVLTGVIAALLASGLEALDAAALGAWWHGAAADGLPASETGFGLLASEVADAMPATARRIHEAARGGASDREGGPGDVLDLRFPGP
ncbi:MAG: NAD(P)H-hydrate dehydratase [bacterium]|nr:NAD(P)H-hydrate dehydratase [bacterium]